MTSRVIEGSNKIKAFNLLRQAYDTVDYNKLSNIIAKGVSIELIDDDNKLIACAIVNPVVDKGFITMIVEGIHGVDLVSVGKCLKILSDSVTTIGYSTKVVEYLNNIGINKLLQVFEENDTRIPVVIGASLDGFISKYSGDIEARMLTSNYVDEAAQLLLDYHIEINPDKVVGSRLTARKNLSLPSDTISETIIILVKSDSKEVIGFTSVRINNQYNMVKDTLYVEYSYLKPEYRKGKAIAILYAIWGKICKKLDCALTGTIYVGCGNHGNATKLDGDITANEFYLDATRSGKLYDRYGKKYEVGFNETT